MFFLHLYSYSIMEMGKRLDRAVGKLAEEDKELLHRWTREVCEYRLHVHFERRAQTGHSQ